MENSTLGVLKWCSKNVRAMQMQTPCFTFENSNMNRLVKLKETKHENRGNENYQVYYLQFFLLEKQIGAFISLYD